MKKMKVSISMLCVLALMMGSLPTVGFADESDITIIVDGETLVLADGKPQIVGLGTTMVPFRAIFEALGFEVAYRESNGTVTSVMGYNTEKDILVGMAVGGNVVYRCNYSAYVNDSMALVNNPCATVSEAAFIDATGRTLVPVRAISEAVGAEVLWVAESRTVIITYETEHYYSATDIPRYEYVTGDAYTSVRTDAYGNPLYVYPWPEPVEKYNDDYVGALEAAGTVMAASNKGDNNKQTFLYESQTNNYLLIQANAGDSIINIIPYSNHVYPYYITGLSGTDVSVTALPNYTYVTGSECLSWAEDDDGSGDHVYKYKYNYDEASYYFEILESAGYECYLSSGNNWRFTNNGLFVWAEIDATLGYIYIIPYVGNSLFEAAYYYDDGTTYHNTDIPTFYAVTGIEAANVEYDEDYGTIDFTYVCSEAEYRAYVRELEAEGFEDVNGDYTILESPKNKYLIVVQSGSYVMVVPYDDMPVYLGTYVPNYTYVTDQECKFWYTDSDGDHVYCYEYSRFDWNTYCEYLAECGYEIFLSGTTEDGVAYVYMTDGSSVAAIMAAVVNGTTYLTVTPWLMEEDAS
ncbi:MAG: copper amine oxidase N-terminal domain-containing protein [Clostridia bacterium]|nr:copper amine oxidase N-terminal domain-containing protein [Clostridia bacterium]